MNFNNNNTYYKNSDQFTCESDPHWCETLRYKSTVDSVSCTAFDVGSGGDRVSDCCNCQRIPLYEHAYENCILDLDSSKKLILNKFFRSTGKNFAEYENLCRGCGYGVFEARGLLCNFCECIVNGLQATGTEGIVNDTSANIYENICCKCSCIYSSEECDCCILERDNETRVEKNVNNKSPLQYATSEQVHLKVSKSFSKCDKRNIFHGLIDSWKRVKTHLTPPQTPQTAQRKRLEIVHNIDGYDNVFSTQDTFDLQRICELKRSQTSCSDQHIYGRLKRTEVFDNTSHTLPSQFAQSHDQLTEGARANIFSSFSKTNKRGNKNGSEGKRPRISKPRLLFSGLQNHDNKHQQAAISPVKQPLYLPDSVCSWMTSLRRETSNYRSYGVAVDDETITLCNPKSIPGKNSIIYCSSGAVTNALHAGAPVGSMTNYEEIYNLTKNFCDANDFRVSNVSSYSSDSSHCNVTLRQKIDTPNCSDLSELHRLRPYSPIEMVHDFKLNLMAKRMQQQTNAIDLRSTPPNSAADRAKRQGIYLKINDTNLVTSSSSHSCIVSTNNNYTNDSNTNVSFSRREQTNNVTEQFDQAENQIGISSERLASRHVAREASTSSNKRCGIYERDSEFVSDILSAFDTFLQRDSETLTTTEASPNKSNATNANIRPQVEVDQAPTAVISNEKDSVCRINTNEINANQRPVVPTTKAVRISEIARDTYSYLLSQHVQASDLAITGGRSESMLQSVLAVVARSASSHTAEHMFDVFQIINNLLLSHSLNCIVIYYDNSFGGFVRYNYNRLKYSHCSHNRLLRKYRRFLSNCQRTEQADRSVKLALAKKRAESLQCADESLLAGVGSSICGVSEERSCVQIVVKLLEKSTLIDDKLTAKENRNTELKVMSVQQSNEVKKSEERLKYLGEDDDKEACSESANTSQESKSTANGASQILQTKISSRDFDGNTILKPPHLAIRDPPATSVSRSNQQSNISDATPLSSTSELQSHQFKSNLNDMAITSAIPRPTPASTSEVRKLNSDEDNIYQPIWKFKTVGEVQERYLTDADYYESGNTAARRTSRATEFADESSLMPTILISNDVEDHGEWETDDEFMFTTQLGSDNSTDACSLAHSYSSATGSTVTGYGSSTTTLASAISNSLTHHLFRNIGIFYSLTEPKLRAIMYDYDRVHVSAYFSKRSWLEKPKNKYEFNADANSLEQLEQMHSPGPLPHSASAAKLQPNLSPGSGESSAHISKSTASSPSNLQLLPDSVQAWKFLLWDVNYVEDEEDMIVSETEILRSQEIKEDIDVIQTQQLNILQRFKSASIGNLIDLPNEDDKKSIAERMRNKLQRGVFKLNVRSPKSEKKLRRIFRRAEATSLYLEDGMKPKHPIFGAPLEHLELNFTTHPHVPRFVVDCVQCIENKDCILQDGLYRASGNKVSIDELKQKLSESYIYDPKLLVTDDIHTLTSLLKLFFRELGAPLIPQDIYERIGRNLSNTVGIETIRKAVEDMQEPNHSTLKFLIKHLTNVAACSTENRMPASNLAIVWGPCLLSANQIDFDIGRMNTLAKVLIENYEYIFSEHERLVS